jgi:hypothetical protein
MPRKPKHSGTQPRARDEADEAGVLLESLRANKQVIEADREDAPLPPGVTHVLVKKPGSKSRLVERRKSFF